MINMKLKSFVLEEWQKDRQQPVYMKNGHLVLDLTIFETIARGEVLCGFVNGCSMMWYLDGRYWILDDGRDKYHLMLVDKDKQGE